MIIYQKCREIITRALGFLHPAVLMAHVRGNYHDRREKKTIMIQEKCNIVALASKYLEDNPKITQPTFSWKWKDQLWNCIDEDSITAADKEFLKNRIEESTAIITDCEQYLWRTSNEYAFIPFIIAKSFLYASFILLIELPFTILGHILQYAAWPVTVYAAYKTWGLITRAVNYLHHKLKRQPNGEILEIDRVTLLPPNSTETKSEILSDDRASILNHWDSSRSDPISTNTPPVNNSLVRKLVSKMPSYRFNQ